ncbi:hypothetical protein F8M41_011976 [Gigaspora margarita]|uniref:Uncharacterized protein n=1 Tax=Gigaspora margarita TaxID=4874 RepID=A0A8H3WYR9_GIGMA|nr:hypothetical protein F8M41_011976 [Gigaspora margarita]
MNCRFIPKEPGYNNIRRLQIENAHKDNSLVESKAKHATKLEKIKLLQNEIKLLKGKLDLFQKDSSKKGSEIMFLKSKIVELALKIGELEHLKFEKILEAIIGRDNKKNTQSEEQSSITKSDNISALLQSRPLDNKSEIRNSVSSLNHDTYVSSKKSEICSYASPSKSLKQYFISEKSLLLLLSLI